MADIELEIVEDSEDIELEIVEARLKPEQSKRVIPGYSEQTVLPDPGMTLGSVVVEAIPEPTERLDISENGEYNVARIGMVGVDVPQGVFPEGTLEITENGTYDVSAFERADVDTTPLKGFVYSEFDSLGWPHCLSVKGIVSLPAFYLDNSSASLGGRIENVEFSDDITTFANSCMRNYTKVQEIHFRGAESELGTNSFSGWSSLKKVVFHGNINSLSYPFFRSPIEEFIVLGTSIQGWISVGYQSTQVNSVKLYDFSNLSSIFALPNMDALQHHADCVIRVPAALLDEWQAAPVWRDLQNVIFEGV